MSKSRSKEATPASREPSRAARSGGEPAGETPVAGGPGVPEALQKELDSLRLALAAAAAERDALQDKWLRARADYENLLRRSSADSARAAQRAKGDLVRSLLPVLEALEQAEAHLETLAEPVRRGLALVHKELFAFFDRQGLAEISALGTSFDPALHHAVDRAESAHAAEGTILEVFQKGYTLDGEVLRHAMVKVAVAPAGKEADAGTDAGAPLGS